MSARQNIFWILCFFLIELFQLKVVAIAGQTALFSGSVPQCVAIGDLNQDGKPDLCVTNAFDDTFSVFIQREDGFTLTGVYHTGVYPGSGNDLPRELILEDFNGDGRLDVAVANSGHPRLGTLSSLTIFSGLPDGDFFCWGSYLTSIQMQTVFSESIATDDLDNDGWSDLVIGNHNADSVSIFKGIGFGKFSLIAEIPLNGSQRGPHSLALRDLNFDGKAEIVGVEKRRMFILTRQRGWTFTVNFINSPFEDSDFRDLEVADIDGDGNWDALVTDFAGRLLCYYGLKPEGVPIRPVEVIELAEFQGLSGIEIGDWDGDGEGNEIILANILNNSVLVFKLASREILQSFTVGEKPRFVRFADLNKDQMGDIIAVNEGDETIPHNPDLSLIYNSNIPEETLRLQLMNVLELRDGLPAPVCRRASGIGMYRHLSQLLLVDEDNNSLVIYDPQQERVLSTILLAPLGVTHPADATIVVQPALPPLNNVAVNNVSQSLNLVDSAAKIWVSEHYSQRILILNLNGTKDGEIFLPAEVLPLGITGLDFNAELNQVFALAPAVQKIYRLTPAGSIVSSIEGIPPGTDLALAENNLVYITDGNSGHIYCYNYSGQRRGEEEIEISFIDQSLKDTAITGIATTNFNDVIYLATKNSAIIQINKRSKPQQPVRKFRLALGNHPVAICRSNNGQTYILDNAILPAILEFDEQLNYARTIELSDWLRPPYSMRPKFMTYIREDDTLLLTDVDYQKALILSRAGQLIANIRLRERIPPELQRKLFALTYSKFENNPVLILATEGNFIRLPLIDGRADILFHQPLHQSVVDISSDATAGVFTLNSANCLRYLAPNINPRYAFLPKDDTESWITFSAEENIIYSLTPGLKLYKYKLTNPAQAKNWKYYE